MPGLLIDASTLPMSIEPIQVEPAPRWRLTYPGEPGCVARNGLLVLITPTHPIYPLDYRPPEMVRVGGDYVAAIAANSLREMFDAARAAGLPLTNHSGFRSYEQQAQLWRGATRRYGVAIAQRWWARPGHSEHQLGLAIDLSSAFRSFRHTPHSAWVAENSWQFGWIVRYEYGTEYITGIAYEPWHLRYIGREAAAAYREGNYRTLEEFLGMIPEPPTPD